MRTLSGGESTTLAGAYYQVGFRVKVANGSGTLIDLSGYTVSVTIDEEVDQPVSQATVSFARSNGSTLSLAPLRTNSTLNRLDDNVTYSPLLDAGRLITIETYTIAIGATPVSGDYKLMFKGYIDSVDAATPVVQVVCRDEGGALVDRWIETPAAYTGGGSMESLIQSILTQWMPSVTLYTPSPTLFVTKAYDVPDASSVMDFLQQIVSNIGWDLRYRWDNGTNAFRLTLSQPSRTNTTEDYTFAASRYINVGKSALDRTNVRNYITVGYQNNTAPAVATDSTSIARFGRRFFHIPAEEGSQIDTLTEAQALADYALSDLKDPLAEYTIERPFFWPSQLGDLYAFSSNSVHFNTTQKFAVVAIHHELSDDQHRTTLTTRGKPSGGYLKWFVVGGDVTDENGEITVEVISETSTERTYRITKGSVVFQVWCAAKEFDSPLPASPWDSVAAMTLPLTTDTLTVQRPIGKKVMLIQLEPRGYDLALTGNVWRATLEGAPPQLPAIEVAYSESGDTGTGFAALKGRGETLVTVQVQTKTGGGILSAWQTPLRSKDGYSYAKQRTLLADEYEHDVAKHQNRFSTIQFRGIVQGTGEIITTDPLIFDRNDVPDILFAGGEGSVATVIADLDTKSVRLKRNGGDWEYWVNGTSVQVDVAVREGNGGGGSQVAMGASEKWKLDVYAYALQRSEVNTSTTPQAWASFNVYGASATPPKWKYVNVAEPAYGGVVVPIALDSDTGGTLTTIIRARYNPGTGFVELGNVTSQLSPSLTTPPTSRTNYTWSGLSSAYNRTATGREFKLELTAEMVSSGAVVASETRSAIWFVAEDTQNPNPPTSGPKPEPPTTPYVSSSAWESVSVTKPALSSAVATITLDATLASGTVELLMRYDAGAGWTEAVDIASLVSPALTTPPAASTAYTYTTAYSRVNLGEPVIFEITANIKQNGIVVSSLTKSDSWNYTP